MLPESNLTWTAPKTAAIDLGYAFYDSGVFNHGNSDVKEIMSFFETS